MAQKAPHLPNEILHKILSPSSSKELSQARSVSREWCAVSTVYLCKRQIFDMTAGEEEEFRYVLETKYLADNVQDLEVIVYPRNRKTSKYKLSNAVRDTCHDLRNLEHLTALTIHFESDGYNFSIGDLEKAVAFRRDVLASVLTPLISSRSIKTPIEYLCIMNFQSRNEPNITGSVGFINLLRNLRTLKIIFQQIEPCSVRRSERGALSERSINFFKDFPYTWLRPACQNLKSLHLSGGGRWGWYPKVDFRHTRFPHLQSLCLGFFIFSHDWQLGWLLSHAGSLRYLRLIRCSMLAFADTTPQFLDSDGYRVPDTDPNASDRTHRHFDEQWSHYFREFASAFPLLQLFSLRDIDPRERGVRTGDKPINQRKELEELHHDWSYTEFISEKYEWIARTQQRKQDEQALLGVLDTMEERNTARL